MSDYLKEKAFDKIYQDFKKPRKSREERELDSILEKAYKHWLYNEKGLRTIADTYGNKALRAVVDLAEQLEHTRGWFKTSFVDLVPRILKAAGPKGCKEVVKGVRALLLDYLNGSSESIAGNILEKSPELLEAAGIGGYRTIVGTIANLKARYEKKQEEINKEERKHPTYVHDGDETAIMHRSISDFEWSHLKDLSKDALEIVKAGGAHGYQEVCESVDAFEYELIRSALGERAGTIVRSTGMDGFRRVCQKTQELSKTDNHLAFTLVHNSLPLLNTWRAEGYEKLAELAKDPTIKKEIDTILQKVKIERPGDITPTLLDCIHDLHSAKLINKLIDMKTYGHQYAEKVKKFY